MVGLKPAAGTPKGVKSTAGSINPRTDAKPEGVSRAAGRDRRRAAGQVPSHSDLVPAAEVVRVHFVRWSLFQTRFGIRYSKLSRAMERELRAPE